MNFKEFTTILSEAKFRDTPPEIIKQVKKVAEIYFNQYNSNKVDITKLIDSKKIVSFEKNKHYREYFNHFKIKMPTYFTPQNKPLAKIKLIDLQTKEEKTITIFCVYGDVGEDTYAAYSENFETINFYDNNVKDLSLNLIESKILHEVTHGFQQYKGLSSKFNAALNTKSPVDAELYYKEPIEYDTHLNEIIYHIREKHQELVNAIRKTKEPAVKKILENRLNLFFQQISTLITADPDSYFELEELTLPYYVSDFEDFLATIKDDTDLWVKFTSKLNNFYEKTTGKDVRGRSLKEDELAKKQKNLKN